MKKKIPTDQGFTLIELLVAMAIGLVIMAAILSTFKSQQDTYIVQTQVSAMQQNLRAAMYMMTRDIQMAGYYTNFDTKTYDATAENMDWDPTIAGSESTRPVLYGRNNDDGSGLNVRDGTDVIVIVKASNDSNDRYTLIGANGESASANAITLSANHLNFANNDFGVLVKKDLSRSEVFQITSVSGGDLSLRNGLDEGYGDGDMLFLADIIVYKVDDSDDPARPCLKRINHGKDGSNFQVIAENVENLQIRYHLSSGGPVTSVTGGTGSNVRAVEIALLARTDNQIRGYTFQKNYNLAWANLNPPNDGYRRRLYCSTIKTRNIGL